MPRLPAMPSANGLPAPWRGEIWFVHDPTDPHSPRRCLIISDSSRNRTLETVWAVPIWSSAADSPTHVRIRPGDGGVRHDSVLICENMALIRRNQLGDGPIGRQVSVSILKAVVRAIRVALDDPEVD